jgi:hypothetical protein
MAGEDPLGIIARDPMGRAQIVAIALCILLNALDGFDVLSISFASPGIAAEWRIDRAVLGVMLSMELIGMVMSERLLVAPWQPVEGRAQSPLVEPRRSQTCFTR